MGQVIISERTTPDPISCIGEAAGECYGVNTSDPEKNYKRGLDCIRAEHGRTWEWPDVYMKLKGYSARVIREFYTHIGGTPSRLQASTRRIDYESGFDYVTPHTIQKIQIAKDRYDLLMRDIQSTMQFLESLGIPKEDCAMVLPISMETDVVCKMNLRTLVDMSHQRMCSRAYWEYREMFTDIWMALSVYSSEWEEAVHLLFKPKCELYGYCTEKKSCGRKPKKGFEE